MYRARGNAFRLRESRFRYKEEILYWRVMSHWKRLSREAMNGTSLAVLKAKLDRTLNNPCKVFLPMARG